jgi:oligopeptidase B
MLFTFGWYDSQVQYWEPAKSVAKLRFMKTVNNLLFFKLIMEDGYGRASGRFEALNEVASLYNFLFDLLGVKL